MNRTYKTHKTYESHSLSSHGISTGGIMLTIERRSKVLLLTLNRAEKRNSLHPDLIDRLSNALAEAANDESLNVVVITGAGTTFCAGLDLNHLLGLETGGRVAYLEAVFSLF